ncbi:MAG: sigma-70 family RNA polymerase sigma factor [Acidobacteriota bacterium]|nr:sigma-70 family RNA polymerase sigma factor [Acidobacteriota bacterium]
MAQSASPPPSPPVAPPDGDLIAGLRAAAPGAFEQLVRTHGGRLLAVARRLLGNEEDARDAVQEAFMNAFRSIGRFEGGSLLSTWLHRIVVNVSLMKLRRRKRKPEESLDHLLPAFHDDGHFADRIESGAEPADQRLAREEEQAAVRAAIDELPDHYRTIVLLRDIEGIGTNEVATELGITPNAVKLRLHRARQALRALVAPRLGRS